MKGVLKQVFASRHRNTSQNTGFAPLAVERPAYLIGDIHGCYDALAQLLDVLDRDTDRPGSVEVVFLGDYVDRGEQSREVLNLLHAISSSVPEASTMLKGNHDQMLLDFLDNPVDGGRSWLSHGGLQTLASFGIGGVTELSDEKVLRDVAAKLADVLSDDLIAWLRSLSLAHRNGNLTSTHAGTDPHLPMKMQSERTMMWGHRDFRRVPREDGQWIAHGHYTTDRAYVRNGRISLDTGAFHSSVLTAGLVLPGERVIFIDNHGNRYH